MVQVEKAKVKEVLHPDDALRRTRKERARHKRQVNRIVVDRNLADAKNWAIKRKLGGGKKLEKRLNTEEDLAQWFQVIMRSEHPRGESNRVDAEKLIDPLIAMGVANTKRQVERMIRTLKVHAFPDGTLDADRFQAVLGKELKLEPRRQIYLVTHHGDSKAKRHGDTSTTKDGTEAAVDLSIPTRLALHRRHVILAALRSHSVVEADEKPGAAGGGGGGGEPSAGWSKEKEYMEFRKTANAMKRAPQWLKSIKERVMVQGRDMEDDDASVATHSTAGSGLTQQDRNQPRQRDRARTRTRSGSVFQPKSGASGQGGSSQSMAERDSKLDDFGGAATSGGGFTSPARYADQLASELRDKEAQDKMASANWADYEVMAERWKGISHEARTNLGSGDNSVGYKQYEPRARSRGGPQTPSASSPTGQWPGRGKSGRLTGKIPAATDLHLPTEEYKSLQRIKASNRVLERQKAATVERPPKPGTLRVPVYHMDSTTPTITEIRLGSSQEDVRRMAETLNARHPSEWASIEAATPTARARPSSIA